jgi:hypothetical protein
MLDNVRYVNGPVSQHRAGSINWQLIKTHWPDLMQIALSIRAARLS